MGYAYYDGEKVKAVLTFTHPGLMSEGNDYQPYLIDLCDNKSHKKRFSWNGTQFNEIRLEQELSYEDAEEGQLVDW